MKSYLKGRKQRVKLFNTVSEWLEIKLGIPQGSILGPLLFNIFLNNIFLFLEETSICNFADDNTIYASSKCTENVILKLKNDVEILNIWFKNNSLVANPAKFQLMFLGDNKTENLELIVSNIILKPQKEIELLGLLIDNKLGFTSHIDRTCSTANKKLSANYAKEIL